MPKRAVTFVSGRLRQAGESPIRASIEELANALTHGLGLIGAIVLSPILIAEAPPGDGRLSVIVYCTTMLLLFSASTLYHGLEETRFGPRWSNKLQLFDHVAIYLFIAGCYTPFLIITLEHSSLKWPVLVTVWAVAAIGIFFKLAFGTWGRRVSVGSYVLLSWISLAVIPELIFHLTTVSSLLLGVGGLFYMGGIWFYFRDNRLFHHAIWHVCVFAGAAAHVAAVATVLVPG